MYFMFVQLLLTELCNFGQSAHGNGSLIQFACIIQGTSPLIPPPVLGCHPSRDLSPPAVTGSIGRWDRTRGKRYHHEHLLQRERVCCEKGIYVIDAWCAFTLLLKPTYVGSNGLNGG